MIPILARAAVIGGVNATRYMTMPVRMPCERAGDQRGGMSAKAAQPTPIRMTKMGTQEGRMVTPGSTVPGRESTVEAGAQERGARSDRDAAGEVAHAVASILHPSDEPVGQRYEAARKPGPVELLGRAADHAALRLEVRQALPEPEAVLSVVDALEPDLARGGLF